MPGKRKGLSEDANIFVAAGKYILHQRNAPPGSGEQLSRPR